MNEKVTLPAGEAMLGQGGKEPFIDFLGIKEEVVDGQVHYSIEFREEHIGNPMIRTFHGGVLAGFSEVVAATHLSRQFGMSQAPDCATMTFDYLRPAFAGRLRAIPNTVRAGRRMTTVSVQLKLGDKLVCIGRFLFPVGRAASPENA